MLDPLVVCPGGAGDPSDVEPVGREEQVAELGEVALRETLEPEETTIQERRHG